MFEKIFLIAEIGSTHEGSLGLAKCFIKAAADCGVNAVKFQTHIFDAESLPDAPNPPYFKNETRREYFERTAFTLVEWKELKRYADEECGVEFISSPFSIEAIEMLENIGVNTYKVPSGEVTNIPYLIRMAKTGGKVLLSSGMSCWDELDEAVKTLKENGCKDLVILQCTSEYPCLPENTGLNILKEMKDRYNLPVGFSDHTIGVAVPIAVVCLGIKVIEKHFTLSKLMYGPDAKFSATPEEFRVLVDGIRVVEKALSSQVDKDKKAELLKEMKVTFEKSIVAASDVKAGTVLEEKQLAYKKPGDGISARKYREIIGRKAKKDVKKNYKFKWEDFE